MNAPRYVPGDDPETGWKPTPEQAAAQSWWEAQAYEACAPEGAQPIKATPADGEPQF